MILMFQSQDIGVILSVECEPSKSPQTEIFFVIEIFSIFPEPLMT